MSLIAGNTGSAIINFGATDDENVGRIIYGHSTDSFIFVVAAATLLVLEGGTDTSPSVWNKNAAALVVNFFNDGNGSNREGIGIQCGVDAPTVAGDNIFARFSDGNGTAAGGIRNSSTVANPEFFNGSDARLKENIVDPSYDWTKIINGLQIRNFNWIDTHRKAAGTQLGFIAQEVNEVWPRAVDHTEADEWYISETSFLIPILGATQRVIKGVQSIEEEILLLKGRIVKLEKRLNN